MRVLQLVQKPQRRGAEVFAAQLTDALRARGTETRIAYLYEWAAPDSIALHAGDAQLRGNEHSPLERGVGVQPTLLRAVRGAVAEFAPDVIQVNGARTVKYGALATRNMRVPPVVVYRCIGEPSQWIKTRRHQYFYKYAVMPRIDGVVAVSDATRRSLLSRYRLRCPVTTIPRGVDTEALECHEPRAAQRARLGVRDDTPVLLYVGSLTPEKRPDLLPHVLSIVHSECAGARLWIVGDGPLRSEVEDTATKLGVAASVDFFGVKPNVADFMGAADALVLCSETEGTPGVLLEAQAVGLPVVATDVGGVRSCVDDGRTGHIVAPNDASALAGAALRLLGDAAERTRMGAAGRQLVAGRFSLHDIVDRYLAFYVRVRDGASERTRSRR